MARRPTTAGSATTTASVSTAPSDSGEASDEVTRCICGNEEFVSTPRTRAANANPGLFLQCEKCHVWQHGFCVGFLAEEDIPDEYYCEQCEPSFHNVSMRHGMLISRYRPVKPPRPPRKSRSREAEASRTPSPNETKQEDEHSVSTSPADGSFKIEVGSAPSRTSSPTERRRYSSETSGTSAIGPTSNGSTASSSSVNGLKKGTGSEGNATDMNDHNAGSVSHKDEPRGSLVDSPQLDDIAHGSPNRSRDHSEELAQHVEASRRPSRSEGHAEQDGKQRRNRRTNSDAESVLPFGGRSGRVKRRSREEEILQRVLEESAREARELEARRHSQDHDESLDLNPNDERSLSPDARVNGHKVTNGFAPSEDENLDQSGSHSNPLKRQRLNSESIDSRGNNKNSDTETELAEPVKRRRDTSSRGARQVRSRRSRSGRKPGARSQPLAEAQRATDKATASSGASARRTPNGVKKCRPRIPSLRSTFQEMRRRVANIIDFSGRTQVEMADEKKSRSDGPLELAARSGDFHAQLEQLAVMGDHNMATLENLTRKLLGWEEQFGPK